ncbi:hypothetical protein KHP60_04365 [Microvirga sp. 3-52]|jgi:hypothetical protein|uniref:hypothetical protein n=1 Tax=Microvirga sp. 3-52 TaxID=2792425 RepID=UPI001ACE9017|nr:hypothetical protein [Microvirga sp. 3-52]MBO1904244.1 hypothetical protein [Microvirga sp. 3-52]MBS7451581.1 hypothetical protein [Microvirga sp. 3-52]
MSEMGEGISMVVFVYGMAIVLGVGKACTLLIWRTLPQSRPGLRREAMEAWQRWTRRTSLKEATDQPSGDHTPQTQTSAQEARDGSRQP